MIERYHLVLAGWALAAGVIVLGADAAAPARVRAHLLAVAALIGAVLGGWGSPRSWPWWIVAALCCAWPDRPSSPHPLGRAVPAMAVISLVGAWSAVPDTEPPLAVTAALAPIALWRAAKGPSSGPDATVALVVAVLGATWVGSAGWGAALATGCAVGMVAVAPVVLRFGRVLTGSALVIVACAHIALALVLPRAIMRRPVPVAVAIALAALVLLGAVCALVRREGQEPVSV
jgi:hypothetical protein